MAPAEAAAARASASARLASAVAQRTRGSGTCSHCRVSADAHQAERVRRTCLRTRPPRLLPGQTMTALALPRRLAHGLIGRAVILVVS